MQLLIKMRVISPYGGYYAMVQGARSDRYIHATLVCGSKSAAYSLAMDWINERIRRHERPLAKVCRNDAPKTVRAGSRNPKV